MKKKMYLRLAKILKIAQEIEPTQYEVANAVNQLQGGPDYSGNFQWNSDDHIFRASVQRDLWPAGTSMGGSHRITINFLGSYAHESDESKLARSAEEYLKLGAQRLTSKPVVIAKTLSAGWAAGAGGFWIHILYRFDS